MTNERIIKIDTIKDVIRSKEEQLKRICEVPRYELHFDKDNEYLLKQLKEDNIVVSVLKRVVSDMENKNLKTIIAPMY